MSREVDKSKKSNIKCEHCKFYHIRKPNGDNEYKCHNPLSDRFGEELHYWNRCKSFEWNS